MFDVENISRDISEELKVKLDSLKAYLKDQKSLAVAFSGGVDSTFLLAVASNVLNENVIAVTEVFATVPEREKNEALMFCKEHDIKQVIVTVDPMKNKDFTKNGPDRCYVCKKIIFSEIKRVAKENGIDNVAEGSNTDDLNDYRPGAKAVKELGALSPLKEAGLSKSDIRILSKAMGLKTWDKPSYACLASRFLTGEEITREKIKMIEQAEQILIDKGFIEERVRLHGNLARIEVKKEDIKKLAAEDMREYIYKSFKEIGFDYVTLDLMGYKTGSMNRNIKS
ncbi:MAG TPA: ATP-dependent sacrificial sulfur transferase LarE [Lachnospiraceae bacterium]|nr:ATP-dependent sacrificial sulfur transferase LarE [Lachnospiraceae bacterium]